MTLEKAIREGGLRRVRQELKLIGTEGRFQPSDQPRQALLSFQDQINYRGRSPISLCRHISH